MSNLRSNKIWVIDWRKFFSVSNSISIAYEYLFWFIVFTHDGIIREWWFLSDILRRNWHRYKYLKEILDCQKEGHLIGSYQLTFDIVSWYYFGLKSTILTIHTKMIFKLHDMIVRLLICIYYLSNEYVTLFSKFRNPFTNQQKVACRILWIKLRSKKETIINVLSNSYSFTYGN